MNTITGGQRGTSALAMFGLLILGAVLGTPGQAPVIGGQELSPAFLSGLSVLIFLGVLWALIQAINTRVLEHTIQPGDLLALLQMREFWVAAIGSLVAGLQLVHVHILDDPNTQAALLTVLQAGAGLLIQSWGGRAPTQAPSNP